MNHFYVDIPAPSLHGNNSEIGAKAVNIKNDSSRYNLYDLFVIFSEEILKVEQKYNKQRKPLFDKRQEAIRKLDKRKKSLINSSFFVHFRCLRINPNAGFLLATRKNRKSIKMG